MLSIDITGLAPLQGRMRSFHQKIQEPDHSWSIRQMAKVWERNFTAEGAAVGGWAELRPYTQEVRIERGYNPEHPILVQTGDLRRIVITSLQNARGPRSVSGRGIAMTSVYHGLQATLNASGAKAENQYGGKATLDGKPRARIPARPFWFVNDEVTTAAAHGLQKWVTKMLGDYQ